MDSMNLSEHVTQVVAEQMLDFYLGNKSSADAYAAIDRAALTWCYDGDNLNATRSLFDALLDAAMDFDIERPINPAIDPMMPQHGMLTIEAYDEAVCS
jgi:hypothetical protein